MDNINKAIHEKVMKQCWHEGWHRSIELQEKVGVFDASEEVVLRCNKCLGVDKPNPDYLNDSRDYWKLLQVVKKHGAFSLFLQDCSKEHSFGATHILLDQEKGCHAIYNFFCS